MTFPAHPELISNGSFSDVPVGAELIANPTFSDAASILPWNTSSGRATIEPWEPRFMRLTYDLPEGGALFDTLGQTLNTMYSVKMRVRGVTSVGLDQGSAFNIIGDNAVLTSANIISNPTLTYEYQDYEFRVWSTNVNFRLYLATAAVSDVVDFDSISIKPLTMLVDNGNFSSLGSDWTVIDNTAGDTVTFGGSSATWTKTDPEAVYLQQDYPVTLGASHKLTYTVLSNTYTGGGTELGLSSLSAYGQSPIPSSVGTHTVYLIVTLDTPTAALRFYSNDTGGSLEITNVSVEELGEEWTFFAVDATNTISIESGGVRVISTGVDISLRQTILEIGKHYKLTCDTTITTGKLGIANTTTGSGNIDLVAGSNEKYFTAAASQLIIKRITGADNVLIDNISVEEVLSEDEWHHLALSIDRDSEWKWYVDGVLTNTMDNSTDAVPTFMGFVGFTLPSTSVIGAAEWFNGYMTEPSLWNIALSASEVKDIYDNMYGGQKCLGVLPFSSDLITNGKFNQIGPELILNGDFSATGVELADPLTSWTAYASGSGTSTVTYDGSTAELNIDASNSNVGIYQSGIFALGVSYKIVVSMKATASFDAEMVESSGASTINTIGTVSLTTSYQDFTFYYVGTGTYDLFIHRLFSASGASQTISIETVSVKELGEDWSIGMSDGSAQTATKYAEILASGCRIVSDDTATPYIGVQQDVVEIGKNYKGSVSVTNSDTGKIRANFGGVNSDSFIDGSNTFYASNTSSISVSFLRNANDVDTTFTHVSAKEVGQGWTAITTTGGTVTFPQGMARIQGDATVGNNAYISQPGVMEIGKSYTMTYRIVSNNGGSLYTSAGVTNPALPSTVGSHEITFISDNTTLNIARAVDNTDVSITNITLTQVGSGNLERWWRMNGTDDSSYIVANQAPNGTVNDLTFANSPLIEREVP
jgi:hypothetical protein